MRTIPQERVVSRKHRPIQYLEFKMITLGGIEDQFWVLFILFLSYYSNNVCLSSSYADPSFYEECKAEYLKQREEYRATGIKKKRQKITSNV